MNIRDATEEDLAKIVAIERTGFADPWPEEFFRGYLGEEDMVFLVAEDLEVVGFLVAVFEGGGQGFAHIHDLAVDPRHRRKYVGTALLEALIRRARERGASAVRLEVRMGNEGARRFYERRGFRLMKTLPCYYEDGEDAYWMELVLPPPSSSPEHRPS